MALYQDEDPSLVIIFVFGFILFIIIFLYIILANVSKNDENTIQKIQTINNKQGDKPPLCWKNFNQYNIQIENDLEQKYKNETTTLINNGDNTLVATDNNQCPPCNCPSDTNFNSVYQRDVNVLKDPLYPPLNRTDRTNFIGINDSVYSRQMYVPTNDVLRDSYRIIGYLVSHETNIKDAGNNNWKVFAKQHTNRGSKADYYIIPASTQVDIKIPLNQDMIVNDRIYDIESFPRVIQFNHPMLNKTPYQFIELPKTDFSSGTRYV